MNKNERLKLKTDMDDCYKRLEKAIRKVITTSGEIKAADELKKIDVEYKALNKKFWDWLDSQD